MLPVPLGRSSAPSSSTPPLGASGGAREELFIARTLGEQSLDRIGVTPPPSLTLDTDTEVSVLLCCREAFPRER